MLWQHWVDPLLASVIRGIPIRGRARLARALCHYAESEVLDKLSISGVSFCMYLRPREHIEGMLHYLGIYEPTSVKWFCDRLKPGAIVLDLGANVGYYSILAALHVGPDGQVFAVEPVPDTYARLLRNLKVNNLTNAQGFQLAISDMEGSASMYLFAGNNCGSHSLIPSAPHSGTITVPTTTLDAFVARLGLSRVDLVKIDVEGSEMRVIRGGRQLLERSDAPDLLMELNPPLLRLAGASAEMVIRELQELGYSLHQIALKGLRPLKYWSTDRRANILASKRQ